MMKVTVVGIPLPPGKKKARAAMAARAIKPQGIMTGFWRLFSQSKTQLYDATPGSGIGDEDLIGL